MNDSELEIIWKTYKRTRDENLRNTLIEHHMPLVRSIAERVLQTLPKSIDVDDLNSAGTFGLMDAINGFDLSRGIKFKTYCTTRIRGSILDELRSQDWVPRLVRLKAHRLERAMRTLESQLGRTPNQAEVAKELDITLDELQAHQAEANAKTIFSLSEKWDDADDDKELEKVEILADRKSNMIISGGVNIYPREVEQEIALHPAVSDVGVFGIPDDEWGESVKAAVELRPGIAATAELESEILEFARERLARYKVPRSIDFEDQLPREESGKLYIRRLRDRYWKDRDRNI